ncbi:MAG: hypothetical protein V1908_04225, partial [Candidatus Peregrinibacteria bacterium]
MQLRNAFTRVARPVTIILLVTLILGNISSAYAAGNVIRGEPKFYYFLTDNLGNITTTLDAEGNIVEQNDYLPFGDERVSEQ